MKINSKTILKFCFLTIFAVILGVTGGLLVGCVNSMPSSDELAMTQPKETTKIYDNQNRLLTQLYKENRTFVSLNKVSPNFQNAIIAIEDYRFYNHHGVDIKSIFRALWIDITGNGAIQGGSTITQQLAKNVFLSRDKTLVRKLQEAVLAIQLERKYTKEEILEFYVNQIYFGSGAYGIQTASQTYFDKDASQLDLAEAAMIAGLPKAPSYYSPYANYEAAKERQELVLNRMAELGYITPSQAAKAKAEDLKAKLKKQEPSKIKTAPYFLDYVLQYLTEKYGDEAVYQAGLKVYTTLDQDIQTAAENAIKTAMPPAVLDSNGIMQPEGAIVAIEPSTGYIKAIVGGRDYQNTQLNRATQSHRSPGSTFKPFVYITALEKGYSMYSVVNDAPVRYGNWSPHNYSYRCSGPVTFLTALTHSLNIPAVKIADELGIESVIETARSLGVESLTEEDANLALALGGSHTGVTPLEMCAAYATMANKGRKINPTCIIRIEDRNGKTLEDNTMPESVQVISENTANTITAMLANVITNGTGKAAKINHSAAGKTGTTDNYKDAWFVGYTADLAAAVWMGHDTPKVMPGVTGGSYPARVWAAFMKAALTNSPNTQLDTNIKIDDGTVENIDEITNEENQNGETVTDNVIDEENQNNNNNTTPVTIPQQATPTPAPPPQQQETEHNTNSGGGESTGGAVTIPTE